MIFLEGDMKLVCYTFAMFVVIPLLRVSVSYSPSFYHNYGKVDPCQYVLKSPHVIHI